MLQGANSTGKAVAKTKLANIKSKNARASLANITMLFPPDTTWRRGWSYVQHENLLVDSKNVCALDKLIEVSLDYIL